MWEDKPKKAPGKYVPVTYKKRTRHAQYKRWGGPKVTIMLWNDADVEILRDKCRQLEYERDKIKRDSRD